MDEWTGNSNIFRTYCKGSGKKSIEKHTGIEQVRTFEDAAQFKSFGGILQKDIIDISFDDPKMSDAVMDMCEKEQWNCLVLENPDNGHIHMYFRNAKGKIRKKSWKDASLACGLIADIHGGETYIPLKVNGVDRFPPIFDKDPGAEYDEVPEELLPVNTTINLWEMREGDGRDSGLYGYENVIAQVTTDVDVIKRIVNNINQFVFAEPLSEKDIDRLTRPEALSFASSSGKFIFNEFGDMIQQQFHVKRINGQLHAYKDGIYVSGYRYLENLMQSVRADLKSNQRTEVLKYLEVRNPDSIETQMNYNLIPFQNGVLDIKTGELKDFSPDYVIMNMIPWNYNPSAYSDLADKTLDRIACGDPEIRLLLEECIGYCFYRRNHLQKSFILTGTGANGKSTFLETLKTVLGERNISQLDIGELDDRFSTVMMSGKLANIGDDISSDFLEGKTLAVFKKAVTGNGIKAENKGQDVFFFKPYTKLLFSANEIPRMKSRGFSAIKRRLLIVPFNAVFDKDDDDFDSDIEDKLKAQDSIEYLIRVGVEGLKRALHNKGFTESSKVQQELEDFEKENNPILGWLDTLEDENYIFNEPVSVLYKQYQVFCSENGFKYAGSNQFSKDVHNALNIESDRWKVNGKKKTFFVRT